MHFSVLSQPGSPETSLPGSPETSLHSANDSWGDSDEELSNSPNAKSHTSQQKQITMLRSQLLILQSENDELKEKVQVCRFSLICLRIKLVMIFLCEKTQ